MTIETAEPHGFHVGQSVMIHGMPAAVAAALDGPQVVTAIVSTTEFQIGVSTSGMGATTNVGIVGIDLEARIPTSNYCCVPGDLCINDHPEAWEMPLVG